MRLSLSELIMLKNRTFSRNEKMSRDQLEAMQLRKFRRLAASVQVHSPFYADIIQSRSIDVRSCCPEDFPILTKSLLMANFDRVVTDRRISKSALTNFIKHSQNPAELFLDEFFVVHTSGSSGEIGIFAFSQKDWARGLAQMGRHHTSGSGSERRKAATFNATDGHYAAISWSQILNQAPFNLYYDLLALEINSPLPSIIDQLNAFQPDSLSGYVNAMKVLAEEQRSGKLRISPREISVGGEVLAEQDKQSLEATFRCPVNNYYATTEHMYMGRSLPGDSTIHLWEDDLIFELHDDHTIVTNLFNLTLPLIRYRMDDILKPRERKTSPWPYTEIEGLIGRIENPPRFINQDGVEDFISPHTILDIFIPGVRRFQMQLQSKSSFQFAVCLEQSLNQQAETDAIAGIRSRLNNILARKKMANVRFNVVVADELPIDPLTRKFRLILDRSLNEAGEASSASNDA
ncbi:N/A [soil metagenome]